MRPVPRLALALALAALAACGGNDARESHPDCTPETLTTSCPEAFAQSILDDDVGRIRDYGEAHSHEWTAIAYERSGGAEVVVVWFAVDPQRHLEALQRLVDHPGSLRVRHAERSVAEMRRIRDEVQQFVDANQVRAWMLGITVDRVDIGLPVGVDGIAAQIAARWGDAVRVTFGEPPQLLG